MNENSDNRSAASAHRVLIVEDEFLIADDLHRLLVRTGFDVAPPVASSDDALQVLAQQRVDFVVLDINLDGALSFDLAKRLQEAAIPFLFLTGYDHYTLPPHFGQVPCMQKPHEPSGVIAEIGRQLGDGASNETRGGERHQPMPFNPAGRNPPAT